MISLLNVSFILRYTHQPRSLPLYFLSGYLWWFLSPCQNICPPITKFAIQFVVLSYITNYTSLVAYENSLSTISAQFRSLATRDIVSKPNIVGHFSVDVYSDLVPIEFLTLHCITCHDSVSPCLTALHNGNSLVFSLSCTLDMYCFSMYCELSGCISNPHGTVLLSWILLDFIVSKVF